MHKVRCWSLLSFKHSVVSNDSVSGHEGPDHTELGLCCLCMLEDTLSHDAAHLYSVLHYCVFHLMSVSNQIVTLFME